MRPDAPRVLAGVTQALAMEVLPTVGTPYATQTAGLAAALAAYAAQEFDRAAARRIEENNVIRGLFRSAAPIVQDAELRKAIESAGRPEDPSDFHVSALQQTNDWLRGLLVRLHEHAESLDDPEGRELASAIWDELVESTRRRHLDSPFG